MYLTVDINYDAGFEEAKHPRGQPGNAGEFAKAGSHIKPTKGTSTGLQQAKRQNGKLVAANGSPLPAHIASLKIPPAWQDVSYSNDPKSPLQVTGKDSKGRLQYVYAPHYAAAQAAAKFARIKELDDQFDKVQKQNAHNRKSADPRLREAADALHLVMQTGIRPGSEDDTAAAKKAYGATTLEGRHVVQTDMGTRLRFVGKKGVALDIPVNDPDTAKMLSDRAKKYGPTGQLFPNTNDKHLRSYAHSLGNGGFKTKDFRTLLGTRVAMHALHEMPSPKTDKDYRKAVLQIAKIVASKLGNTPTVALQSYISPTVFAPWQAKMEHMT